jgi:hypothetical protein
MHDGVHAGRVTSKRRSRISKFGTLFVSIGLLAGLTAVAAPSVGAAATWSVATTPALAGSVDSSLKAISCPATNSCFAVGKVSTISAVKTLVEHWNGSAFGILPSPNPSTIASLSGIDCPNKTSCFAVGNYTVGSTQFTLAEHWNGSAWSILPSPNPSNAVQSGLTSVSCPSAGSCFAVGIFATNTEIKTLTQHWNGSNWGILPSVNPSATSILNSVDCSSVRSCYAVGNYTNAGGPRTFVEHWNGVQWGTLPTIVPSGSTSSTLTAVTCASLRSCFAVGNFQASTRRNLIEHWNGVQWGTLPAVNPSPTPTLSGIACAAVRSCFAVGNSTALKSLIQHWNGSAWATMPHPSPGSFNNHLFAAACPSTSFCLAVGDFTSTSPGKTVALRYG